jgi:hypothetical protein
MFLGRYQILIPRTYKCYPSRKWSLHCYVSKLQRLLREREREGEIFDYRQKSRRQYEDRDRHPL